MTFVVKIVGWFNGHSVSDADPSDCVIFDEKPKNVDLIDGLSDHHAKSAIPDMTSHEAFLITEWYETSVAKYSGASDSSRNLYNGFGGSTLMRFMMNNAEHDVAITEAQMIEFLTNKGHRSNMVVGRRRFYGIRIVIGGNVRSGNYAT